jgi:hypothetical protein
MVERRMMLYALRYVEYRASGYPLRRTCIDKAPRGAETPTPHPALASPPIQAQRQSQPASRRRRFGRKSATGSDSGDRRSTQGSPIVRTTDSYCQ